MSLFDSSSPGIVVLTDVPFPANVVGGPGIEVDRSDPTAWLVELDYPALAINAAPQPSETYVATYDSGTQAYSQVRIDTLIDTATGLDTRTVMVDADYTALTTDRYIAIAAPFTLNRTLHLPAAASVPGGREILIQDEIGTLTAQHFLVISPIGGDAINGKTLRILSTPYGGVRLRSNGVNAWNAVTATSMTSVSDSNYTCNADDKIIALTALTAPRTVTLPPASAYTPGQRIVVLDQNGQASATNTITVLPSGSDTINGISTSPPINGAYGFLGFVTAGVSKWTIVDNVGGGGGSGSITSSQITDASPLGRLLLTQTTAAQDRTSLGSGTTGDVLFQASSPASARTTLGSTTVGDAVFIATTQAAAQTALGLGTMATQNANNVNITGGTITGIPGLGGGANITMADTPPGSPTEGALWYDTAGGNLYVWHNDGTSSQWIVANNPGNAFLPSAGGTISGNLAVTGTTALTGAATGPTPAAADNSTKLATTAFVAGALGGTVLRNYLAGLNLTYQDATHVTVNPGVAAADDNSLMMSLSAGITKTLAAWNVGAGGMLDTGAAAANSFYHIFLIERPDTGVVDVLASLSLTPTLPTNYTKKRRIMCVITTGTAGQMFGFTQYGDEVLLGSPATLYTGTVGTAAVNISTFGPPGVVFEAIVMAQCTNAANATHGIIHATIGGYFNLANVAGTYIAGEFRLFTNTSRQIVAISSVASSTHNIYAIGWKDTRGRFA